MDDARSERDSTIPTRRPPTGMSRLGSWDVADVSGLTSLRTLVRDAVRAAPAAAALSGLVEHATLLVTELTTNALTHTRAPARVQLLGDADSLVLDVADHDPTAAPVLAGRRGPGEGGFGLMITLQLAAAVGWYQEPDGKHVWALLTATGQGLPPV